MKHHAKSVRAFIGAKDFEVSRSFYTDLGFKESIISKSMSYFTIFETLGFYLQNAYVEDWVNNSMIFLEVDNVEQYWTELQHLGLQHKYTGARLVPIRYEDWGSEFFLHDPSGILWHFGNFKK
jgi:catechol 2,3-dioxygenase-like lactoylglutathione lyase family enzyme